MYTDGKYLPERRYNPFVRTATGGRVLSAFQLPWFMIAPPPGFGVITVTGRKSGKRRRRCVRGILSGDRVFLVAIGGTHSAWLGNIRAHPRVDLRLHAGYFSGHA